jgi:1-deoxy-D-xylulose-5-phosphate reductoisomerase
MRPAAPSREQRPDARGVERGAVPGVAVLGSTGSIGTAALRVIDRHRDQFRVVALTAYGNETLLREQAARYAPALVGFVSGNGNDHQEWRTGADALVEAATHPDVDIVLNAVVGAAGLRATIAALEAGKRVALANKESLVTGAPLVAAAKARGHGEIVPVDSEHSAILQCIAQRPAGQVDRLILTASGGPFRGWSRDQLARVTVADALRHPTWTMGRKITVDSATLANKALEVIEAHYLFDVPYDRIGVVVHPQSLVHSFVQLVDGSVLAQIGVPSMELPILYALTYPDRIADSGVPRFDPLQHAAMTFEPADLDAFPTLRLGIAAGRQGGAAPAVFNAANEEAVARFLGGSLPFMGIPRAIESALAAVHDGSVSSLDALLDADDRARRHVRLFHA